MKLLVLVLSLWTVVFARPDVSHLGNLGYHYKPPSTNYGVPVDNGHVETSHHYHHHHAPSDSYGAPLNNKYSGTVQINQGVPSGSYIPGNIQFQLPHINVRTDFLGGSSGSKYEGYNPHLIQDQKHVYYYAVPDDEEPARLRIHVTPSNKKNTNVIFVKAPTYAPAIPEVIVPQHQAEEKTKVFVLVKKPEQPAPISIPAPAPVKSHPEVYVVKYENQDEAERVISGGRGGHPVGFNVHNLGDEATFVTALKSDSRQHLPHNDKYSGFDGSLTFFGARTGVGKDVSVGGDNSEGSIRVTGNVPQSGPILNSFGVRGGFVKESDGSSFLSAPFGSSITGSSGSLGVFGGLRGSGSLNSFGGSGSAGSSGSLNSFGVAGNSGPTGSLNTFGVSGGAGSSGSLNSFGVSGGAERTGSFNTFGVSGGAGSSGSLNSFGGSGGVGSSGSLNSFGGSGGIRSSGSLNSFGVSRGAFGGSGGVGSSGSLNSFGVSGGAGSGSLNSFGVSGGVGSSGSFGGSGGVRSSGSLGSFGVQVVGSGKSDKTEAVVDSGKKSSIEIIIGDEKSGVDSSKDDSHVSGSFGIQRGIGSSSGVKNTAEIKTVGQEFSSPLFESFGKSAVEVRAGGGERGDSVSESSLSGSITAGTEKSSVVDVTAKGVPFVQYGPPSSSGPY